MKHLMSIEGAMVVEAMVAWAEGMAEEDTEDIVEDGVTDGITRRQFVHEQ